MKKVSTVTAPVIFDDACKNPSFIHMRKKSKTDSERIIVAISTNGNIVFNGESYTPLEDFMYKNKGSEALHMVLTDRELLIIKEFAVRYNVMIRSIESYYPFLSGIKYHDDVGINLRNLLKSLRYAKSLGLKNQPFAKTVTKDFRNTLLRKLHKKSEYDSKFYFSYSEPYQEVFRFRETRKDRIVVALDFNSMFSSCIKGDFVDPRKLEFISINDQYDGKELPQGLYRVVLQNPTSSFIKKYHLFRLTKDFKRYSFSLLGIKEIEATLHKEEVEYYYKHFSSIWIKNGYISKNSIGHPLFKKSIDLYKKRLRSKLQGKKTLEKKYKLELAMIHSITNSKSFKSRNFKNTNEVSTFLKKEFDIELDFSKEAAVRKLFKHSHFSLTQSAKGFTLRYVDTYSRDSVYSLSSQVMAKVRLKMLTLLEEVLDIGGVELCYVNTDCVHVSFPKTLEEEFWEKTQHLIGDELGKLKVEAIADSGYWFDVGRYFLYDEGQVIKFSNSGLNHRGNSKPFLLTKPIVMHYKSKSFSHVSKIYSHLPNLLTYSKRLSQNNGYSDFSRFTAEQILDSISPAQFEQEERGNSSETKIDTYYSLMKSKYI
ncbi:hypothetical protein AAFX30_11785 [Vibrio chagasii]|uniref:hypothetical protein n=1 Tax=Vibrio chagasii TaxID=170679 RepID=UPI0038CD1A0F